MICSLPHFLLDIYNNDNDNDNNNDNNNKTYLYRIAASVLRKKLFNAGPVETKNQIMH